MHDHILLAILGCVLHVLYKCSIADFQLLKNEYPCNSEIVVYQFAYTVWRILKKRVVINSRAIIGKDVPVDRIVLRFSSAETKFLSDI